MFELTIQIIIVIMVIAYLCEYMDSTLGMGYGPLVVSGQILSGVEGKNAIGITSMAEGITCALGVLIYFFTAKNNINWQLAPIIIAGAVCAVPFSAKSVKIINPKLLKALIALLTIILGVLTLFKTLKKF